jgi:uncharacterized protein (DUF885 family)
MTPAADSRWQQRLSNFERALALLREAIHQQYLPAVERLLNFLQQEVTP